MHALYSAWERTPAPAMSMAASIGYKPKDRKRKAKSKAGIEAFLSDFAASGGKVNV